MERTFTNSLHANLKKYKPRAANQCCFLISLSSYTMYVPRCVWWVTRTAHATQHLPTIRTTNNSMNIMYIKYYYWHKYTPFGMSNFLIKRLT